MKSHQEKNAGRGALLEEEQHGKQGMRLCRDNHMTGGFPLTQSTVILSSMFNLQSEPSPSYLSLALLTNSPQPESELGIFSCCSQRPSSLQDLILVIAERWGSLKLSAQLLGSWLMAVYLLTPPASQYECKCNECRQDDEEKRNA